MRASASIPYLKLFVLVHTIVPRNAAVLIITGLPRRFREDTAGMNADDLHLRDRNGAGNLLHVQCTCILRQAIALQSLGPAGPFVNRGAGDIDEVLQRELFSELLSSLQNGFVYLDTPFYQMLPSRSVYRSAQ